MFDLEVWRAEILQRLRRFVRAPQTEMGIYGTERLTYYLSSLVLEPFFQAFTNQPLRAVVTLANVTQTAGTSFLIHNANTLRYSQQLLWSEFEHSPALRLVIEQILLKLDVIEHLLHTLDDTEAHWLRQSLSDEIEPYRRNGELTELRHALNEIPWQTRYSTVRSLQTRRGHYTGSDWQLIEQALSDRVAMVRAAGARQLGRAQSNLAAHLRERLFHVALYDRDLGARYAAARSIGTLRNQLIDSMSRELLTTALFHDDSFVRSAACLVLGQLGSAMVTPSILDSLISVLQDADPYAREAAANAFAAMGQAAATTDVLAALRTAVLDSDQYVHEAALGAITALKD